MDVVVKFRSGAQSRSRCFVASQAELPAFHLPTHAGFLERRPNIYIRYQHARSFRTFAPYTPSLGPMAKKKTAVPPEQAAGPSLIICRNK